MKQKRMAEVHRINAMTLISYSIMTFALLFAYLLEFIKGDRSFGYTAIFIVLDLLPYLTFMMLYKKNKTSPNSKYVLSVGFSVLYAFVLLTAAVPTTVVYMFLVLIMIIPYGDIKLLYASKSSSEYSFAVAIYALAFISSLKSTLPPS